MTSDEKLKYWRDEWTRIFMQEANCSRDDAERIIQLAELNGIFDPLKALFAVQELVG